MLEQDPELAWEIGLKDDGQGNEVPAQYSDPNTGQTLSDKTLAGNEYVSAALNDFVGQIEPGSRSGETLNHVLKGMSVMHQSNIRDVFSMPSIWTEVMKPSEARFLFTELLGALNPKNIDKGIASGTVLPARNVAPGQAQDYTNAATRLVDAVQRWTGNETFSKAIRTWNDLIARAVVRNRLNRGDTEFIKEWSSGINRNDPDELFEEMVYNLSQNATGSYNALDQPKFTLKGSDSNLKPFLVLARWPIGRFNRWMNTTWRKAKEGNLRPLIQSLLSAYVSSEVFNELWEKMTGRGPRELKFKEWYNLKGEDSANTLVQKLTTLGYAGWASQLAMLAVATANGEKGYGMRSLMATSIADSVERIRQYAGAVKDGTAGAEEFLDLLGQLATDRIQLVRWLNPTPDEEGKREEVLAKRLGYMPKQSQESLGRLRDPFSMEEAYRKGDVEAISKHMIKSIDTTGKLPEPRKIRRPLAQVQLSPDGDMKFGYYDFIERAQGRKAADERLDKDIDLDIRRKDLYGRAITSAMENPLPKQR